MLSPHNVVSQRPPAPEKMPVAVNKAPETGQFDFLSYLLGLQDAGPNEIPGNPSQLSIPGKAPAAEDTDDPLARLFSTKKRGAGEEALVVPAQAQAFDPARGPVPSSVKPDADSAKESPLSKVPGKDAGKFELPGFEQVNQGDDSSAPLTGKNRELALKKYATLQNQEQSSVQNENPVALKEEQAGFEPDRASTSPSVTSIHGAALSKEGEGLGEKSDRQVSSGIPNGGAAIAGQAQHTDTASGLSPSGKEAAAGHRDTPASVNEVFHRVESMIHNGGGKMTVSLNPPDLGKLEIQVRTKGNKVEIEMRSQNELAKSVLESRLGELKHSMRGQDLVLHKMEVHVSQDVSADRSMLGNSFSNLANGGQTFSDRQSFAGQADSGRSFTRENKNQTETTRAAAAVPTAPVRTIRSTPGSVDIRI